MSTKAVRKKSAPVDEYEVSYTHNDAKGCFEGGGEVRIKKRANKIKLKVRNNHHFKDMLFVVTVTEARDRDGNPIRPLPNPFKGNITRGIAPARLAPALAVKGKIGIGDGGFVEGLLEPENGCRHVKLRPHTDWHIEC